MRGRCPPPEFPKNVGAFSIQKTWSPTTLLFEDIPRRWGSAGFPSGQPPHRRGEDIDRLRRIPAGELHDVGEAPPCPGASGAAAFVVPVEDRELFPRRPPTRTLRRRSGCGSPPRPPPAVLPHHLEHHVMRREHEENGRIARFRTSLRLGVDEDSASHGPIAAQAARWGRSSSSSWKRHPARGAGSRSWRLRGRIGRADLSRPGLAPDRCGCGGWTRIAPVRSSISLARLPALVLEHLRRLLEHLLRLRETGRWSHRWRSG